MDYLKATRISISFIHSFLQHINKPSLTVAIGLSKMPSNLNSMALINPSRAATSRLSPELLSEIFEFSITLDLPEIDLNDKWGCSRPVVQVLGAVCATWRHVAWGTPQLWTTIIVDFKSSDICPQIFLLKLYLENAGNLPLELSLWWDSDVDFAAPDSDVLVDASVDEMIKEALRKVTSLYLSSPPSLSSWLFQVPRLVSLDHLIISESSLPNNDPLDLSGLTVLSKFNTYNLQSDVILPWQSITKLHLSGVPIEICVKLLLQCPSLELCTMDGGLLDAELNKQFEPLVVKSPVILPHLKTLVWECLGTLWEKLILQYVEMPSLRDLSWVEDSDAENSDLLLTTFCQRLPDNLRSVTLISNSPHGFPLSTMPLRLEVEEMELESYAFSPMVFSTIVLPLQLRPGPQPSWAFPRLKLLSIHNYSGDPIVLSASETKSLLETLAWRAADLDQMITLDVFNVTLNWDLARFPGPLYGGENLIVREGVRRTVPPWYHQLVPGTSRIDAYDSDSSDSD